MSLETDRAELAYLPTSLGEPVEVMRVSYRRQSFPRHSHDYYTIGVMLGGRGTMWYRGAEHLSVAGDVVLIPPGEIHTGEVARDADVFSYLALHAPPSLVAAAAAENGMAEGAVAAFRSPVIRDGAIAAALCRLGALMKSKDVSAIDDLLTQLIGALVTPALADSHSPTLPPFVRRAMSIIEASYADPTRTSLLALSRSTGVTPFHLVREFTASTGLSPHRYLVQTRVRRACELLSTGMSVSLVAASTGFADQSHLTTQFKRYVGMTPAAYGSARVITSQGASADDEVRRATPP